MQDIIENVLIQTSPTTNPKLEILKTHFPECFDKEGKLLVDKLEKSLMGGGGVEFSKESYSLNWLGKSYASVLRNEPPTTWIKPNHSFNSTHPNSQNFLIKGDNLEALKLLKNTYEKKIKMIYIDPPYNTGSDGFVYTDDYKYTPKKLSSLCGMSEEDCKKMLEYYSKGKNSHSAWLTFMYPRLSLARNLLKEDGVIFISIDDNEQAQLKLLCDEIFGEENFIETFLWNKTQTPPSASNKTRKTHEFILCYQRNKNSEKFIARYSEGGDAPLWNETNSLRTLVFPENYVKTNLEDGVYLKGKRDKIELLDDVVVKDGMISNRFQLRGHFRWKQETLDDEINNGVLLIVKSDTFSIRYCRDGKREVMPTNEISKKDDVGTNENASSELKNLFNGSKIFDFSKPSSLIKFLVKICNIAPNDIILDFFAGSGTTAQAVMELNAEDNGNRRFILVQLPESIDEKKSKTAYDFVKNTLGIDEPKISDITQERIIRASKQIQEKYPEYKGDLGFQVFELEEIPSELAEIRQSNFEKINHLFANEDIDKMLDIEAILQSFCLYDSIPLGAELEKVDLGGYGAYRYGNRLYLLHQGFETKHLQELLRRNDEDREFCVNQIVLLAYCFESARFREIAEAIKYTSKKSSELALVVRG